jgi:hypothetical protein
MSDMFTDKDMALHTMYSLLQLVDSLAKRHDFPLIAALQFDSDTISIYHHFPGNTGSELRTAWQSLRGLEIKKICQICGNEDV